MSSEIKRNPLSGSVSSPDLTQLTNKKKPPNSVSLSQGNSPEKALSGQRQSRSFPDVKRQLSFYPPQKINPRNKPEHLEVNLDTINQISLEDAIDWVKRGNSSMNKKRKDGRQSSLSFTSSLYIPWWTPPNPTWFVVKGLFDRFGQERSFRLAAFGNEAFLRDYGKDFIIPILKDMESQLESFCQSGDEKSKEFCHYFEEILSKLMNNGYYLIDKRSSFEGGNSTIKENFELVSQVIQQTWEYVNQVKEELSFSQSVYP